MFLSVLWAVKYSKSSTRCNLLKQYSMPFWGTAGERICWPKSCLVTLHYLQISSDKAHIISFHILLSHCHLYLEIWISYLAMSNKHEQEASLLTLYKRHTFKSVEWIHWCSQWNLSQDFVLPLRASSLSLKVHYCICLWKFIDWIQDHLIKTVSFLLLILYDENHLNLDSKIEFGSLSNEPFSLWNTLKVHQHTNCNQYDLGWHSLM